MHGSQAHMGTLRVFVLVGSQATVIGSYSDNRGNVWNLATITIRGVQPYQVNSSLTAAFSFRSGPVASRGKVVCSSSGLLSFILAERDGNTDVIIV